MNKLLSLLDTDFEFDGFGEFGFTIMPIIFGVIFSIIFFTAFITIIVKTIKGSHSIGKKVGGVFHKGLDLAHQKLDEQLNPAKPEVCEYCGAVIPSDKNECTSCGAKKRVK